MTSAAVLAGGVGGEPGVRAGARFRLSGGPIGACLAGACRHETTAAGCAALGLSRHGYPADSRGVLPHRATLGTGAQQQRKTFTLGRGQRWSTLDEPVDVLIEALAVALPAALS